MTSSDEIREAMEAMREGAAHDWQEAATMIACVRELYEALNDALRTDSYVCQVEAAYVQHRYRAALEGSDDETQ
jgi:hypothetical protein